MPDASAEPVCSCAHFLVHLAHETAGAARTRHSLHPPIFEGEPYPRLGRIAPRDRGGTSFVMPQFVASARHPEVSSILPCAADFCLMSKLVLPANETRVRNALAPSARRGGGTMSDPILEMRRVSKSFFSIKALRNVDLTVYPGEIHALMGENGAGKSTLMKILSGAYRPDPGGEIRIEGRLVRIDGPHGGRAAGISIIYQELSLPPNLSG